jgi:hypothetical protein
MNHRYAVVLLSLGIAACATPSPESTEANENAGSLPTSDIPTAAEAVIVKHNVPQAAKDSGLVNEDTLVCKKEKVVGSHIPRMVCLSAKDHENIQKTSQSYMGIGKRAPEPKNPEG